MIRNPKLRGIFTESDDPNYWIDAIKEFPNKIPRFDNKQDAINFTKQYCQSGSNPDAIHMQQSISTLISWNQIETYLLPKMRIHHQQYENNLIHENNNNRFININNNLESSNGVLDYLESRLNLSIHQQLTYQSTMNTLKYLFYHMRCGILVMIRQRKVVVFCPFVNKDYTNNWYDQLHVNHETDNIDDYFNQKSNHYRRENYIPKDQWWANGNIICNEHSREHKDPSKSQLWGDQFLFQLKDMLVETCRCREVPDCDFFINKRDYPQLKFNSDLDAVVEPYGFIYDRDDKNPNEDIPLSRHSYTSYAPIMSFYTSSRFADIPFPTSEDWEAATGKVFPSSFSHRYQNKEVIVESPRDLFTKSNLEKFQVDWDQKIPCAFFRGTATGGGVTIETNQRLHLASLSYDWSQSNTSESEIPYLDAKITGWNLRDKKIYGSKMTYLKKSQFPFEGDRKTNYVPIYEQSKYKYLIYVEGHCAACRYGFMMQLDSVILKVDSKCVADQLWYFPLLKPYVDHIPIKADLSDLKEKIQWCRDNDDKCREIISNARKLYYEYISKEGILDYLQSMFIRVSKNYLSLPKWMQGVSFPIPRKVPTFDQLGRDGRQRCCVKDGRLLCITCEKIQAIEIKESESLIAVSKTIEDQEKEAKLVEKKRKIMEKKQQAILESKRRRLESEQQNIQPR